ncbi:MAG: DUF4383 domain-containing protein [Methanobacteriota archaeon]
MNEQATLYAKITGVVLVLIGIVGFFMDSIGGASLIAFDNTHNVIHLVLGVIALAVGFGGMWDSTMYAKTFGIVYLALGVLGFVSGDLFGIGTSLGLGLEMGENVIHLVLGLWGLWAGFFVASSATTARPA